MQFRQPCYTSCAVAPVTLLRAFWVFYAALRLILEFLDPAAREDPEYRRHAYRDAIPAVKTVWVVYPE